MAEYSIIGKRVPRIDAPAKATGEAKYAADLKMSGTLHAMILRSPLPHARILNIDTGKAQRLPGVKAVITGKDTPGYKFGIWRIHPQLLDKQGLAVDKVRFIGDEVAAVAAIDEDTATEALSLIKVDYEELPTVFDPEEAMQDGAPRIHDYADHNISFSRHTEYGDVEKGFKEAYHIREDRFVTHAQAHSPMETHTCLASFDGRGKLTLWSSTQAPYFVQVSLAEAMGMRPSDVRVIKPHVGGGFGNKVELHSHEFCAAILSKKTGRPVKIQLTRAEELVVLSKRHPMVMVLKTGVKKDGTLVAREYHSILEGGAYNTQGPITTLISGFHYVIAYRVPNYRYIGQRVYTNNPPSGAMRGHGALQPIFAGESQLDMIADDLGLDRVELRLKNATQTGDYKPGVAMINSCGLTECIQECVQRSGWKQKWGKLPKGRGIGMACNSYASGAFFNYFNTSLPYSESQVKLSNDGTALLFTMAADIGQGSDTVLSQIVAEVLGLHMEDVKIIAADTDLTPVDLGSWSSRVTTQAGNATKQAAEDALSQVLKVAAAQLSLRPHEELEARDRRIYVKTAPQRGMSFAEAVLAAERTQDGAPIWGRGIYTPRGKVWMGSPAWSFGTQVAEVEVDEETGQVKVLQLTAAHDCGRALNPMSVEGQLEGAIHMGLGYGLSENLIMEKGKVLNASFMDYKLMSALDMPQVESIAVETNDPGGPFGAKEAGEGLSVPTAGALANAVYNAIGVRLMDLPITPEKIIRALKEKKKPGK